MYTSPETSDSEYATGAVEASPGRQLDQGAGSRGDREHAVHEDQDPAEAGARGRTNHRAPQSCCRRRNSTGTTSTATSSTPVPARVRSPTDQRNATGSSTTEPTR